MRSVRTYAAIVILLGAGLVIVWLWPRSVTNAVLDERGKSEVFVTLSEDGFIPAQIRIERGTKVTFTTTRDKAFWPASNPHPAHTIYPAFDAQQPVAPDSSWSYTFTTSGAWSYHDHVRSYYTGVVYVD